MRARAAFLTLAVVLVVLLTAIAPQAWHRVKAETGTVLPTYYIPPGVFAPRLFIPFVANYRCTPVQTVEVVGETEGLPGIYTFTVEVTPDDAATPLTYSWDNGETGETSTRELAAGTYTLEVTVCNCDNASCVSDDHVIRIGSY